MTRSLFWKNSSKVVLFILFLCLISSISALPLMPQGNIDMQNRYNITRANYYDNIRVIQNVTASWFKGRFNWVVDSFSLKYVTFNGTQFRFNETKLNLTINALSSNVNGTNETLYINAVNLSKLNKKDQRYNETLLIKGINSTLRTYADNINNSKLGKFDQRYNETLLVKGINTTAITLVNNVNLSKLNKFDQRYNDTVMIRAVNTSVNTRITNVNASLYSRIIAVNKSNNRTNYWDGLNTPLGITEVGTLVSLTVTNNISAKNVQANMSYSFVKNYPSCVVDTFMTGWGVCTSVNQTKLNVNRSTWWSGVSSFTYGWFIKSTNALGFNETKLGVQLTANNNTLKSWTNSQIATNNASLKNYLDAKDSAYNLSLVTRINLKLTATDQRYNETSMVRAVNKSNNRTTFWSGSSSIGGKWLDNIASVMTFNESQMNISIVNVGRRYNETTLIKGINTTTMTLLNNVNLTKLSKLDRRYNDTSMINAVNKSNNRTTWWTGVSGILGSWLFKSGNNLAFNQTINNITIIAIGKRYNETLLTRGVNTTLYTLVNNINSSKLNKIDQRYNSTAMIRAVNKSNNRTTWWAGMSGVLGPWIWKSGNTLTLNLTINNLTIIGIGKRYNETLLIKGINTTTITLLNNVNLSKLNKLDGRYNDTTSIKNSNTSLKSYTDSKLALKVNLTIPKIDYKVLSYWTNITGRWLYLSNFTNNLNYNYKAKIYPNNITGYLSSAVGFTNTSSILTSKKLSVTNILNITGNISMNKKKVCLDNVTVCAHYIVYNGTATVIT